MSWRAEAVKESPGRQGLPRSTPHPPPHRWPVPELIRMAQGSHGGERVTYVVARLFILVALLVRFGLGLIWLALLLAESLPSLTKDLADLT